MNASSAAAAVNPVPAALPAPQPIPALIVLGLDEAGKSHASWFDADEAELATKAAGLMGMVALPVATDALRDAASRLPHGRVFSSGKAFVPFVKAATFDALVKHLPKGTKIVKPAPRPKLVEKTPAGSTAASKATGGTTAGSDASPETLTMPPNWTAIAVGSLVLASEGKDDGWYESVVVEAHEDELFTLRWRDWPELPTFVRRRVHLGLLHPNFVQA